ncbi:cell wall-binding protein [Desulfitobacterium dichloroeliminans LMG P-21439]|uniref:Cell wall-binding protein n=1 Tax=Desulfitobacterium dichloroeliminans (strain LMG P-21439 / DCA1) TaxID=871963 RepID=L0FD99_DESDL|nr:cell wall-binding repeat-containing protein [Desulfitobacterium dichloroeliminans]AGA70616.1 cell wall-binding protein [Desulfitobacterium dichloroeliminans LMG P-21439]
MKKTKKALASLAIAGMVLSMAPASVFAATTTERLAGADRYETSIAIAEKAYASADTAVVAAGNPANLVDALAAAPLAAQEDAPIYLTDKADMNNKVVDSLKDLGVKDVIVVGAAASQAVVDELKAAGFNVEAIQGASRVETAAKINAKLTAPAGNIVVGYNGVADAMSVASYAAANNYAIVVADRDGSVPAGTEADYIIGGPTLVKNITGADRLYGADRYATNAAVIEALDFEFGKVYVGNGATLADALVGSVLAAQTNSPIILTDGKTVKADVSADLADDSVIVALGGAAVVSNAALDAVKNGAPSTGEFKVESVTAASASTFKVKFSKAPADTAKVTFEVKQATAPVTVSVSWNEAKTEATLAKSSNFVTGTYTVAVKNDATSLGTSEVKVTEQKVAKIEITSTKLGVVNTSSAGITTQTGYATYKIVDQYGIDITNAALANNVQFQSGVGDVTGRKGLLTITPTTGLNLLTFTGGIVITANDMSSGVSTSATLAATSQIGTLSDIQLTKLTNADGKELVAGSTTDVFYVDYTAKDISGNLTNSYTLLKQGLILQTGDLLTTSSPYVKAELVQDPKDSSKGLIKVTTTSASITLDMPVVITAMTWTGKTSQLSTTLKKQAEVDKITLFAPADAIASTESKVIPFAAYDQNGKQLTKWTDLVGSDIVGEQIVKLTGAYWVKNLDGTASIKNDPVTNNSTSTIPTIISAVTKTGSFSSLTINIQKPVKADALSLDSTVLKSLMQASSATTPGAIQTIDFGYDAGGFEVKDQYGRVIDMTTADKAQPYKVTAYSDATSVITATGAATSGKTAITVNALAAGTATVRFDLIDTAGTVATTDDVVIDSKAQTFTVLQDKDIKGYTIDAVSSALYTVNVDGSALTDQEKAYTANPKVYGTTTSGAKVVLRGTPVLGASVDSSRFVVSAGASGGNYKSVKVLANKLPDTTTEATANLNVTVLGADNAVHALTTAIKSTKESPVAKSIEFAYDTSFAGVSYASGTLTVKAGSLVANGLVAGNYLTKYDTTGTATASEVYFYAVDQYGKKGMAFDRIVLVDAGTTGMTVDADGKIGGTLNAGTAKISAVVGGFVKTVQIKIVP